MKTPTKEVELLFQLSLTAKEDGQLSEMLQLNSRLTKAESYDVGGNAYPVSLVFGTENGLTEINNFELFQNVPNPFSDGTIIGFQLPEASNASFTLFDVSGKILKETSGQYARGYHEINIDKTLFPNSGVFYYRLETPDHTATKKMTKM